MNDRLVVVCGVRVQSGDCNVVVRGRKVTVSVIARLSGAGQVVATGGFSGQVHRVERLGGESHENASNGSGIHTGNGGERHDHFGRGVAAHRKMDMSYTAVAMTRVHFAVGKTKTTAR